MDHKPWPWRKKSSEKITVTTDNTNLASKENQEVQALLADKEELEKDLKRLNDKLTSAISDCNAKGELLKKQTKIAQEATAGYEKAKAEVLSMKHDFDEALQQRLIYEERVVHLDGALKECMQQLRFVREEQGRRVHDAVMKASKEFEKERMVLEEQLSEVGKWLAKAETENSHLNKSILAKENLIEDLKRQLNQAEANHNALMIKLDSIEKENASFKYEVRVLEKELEIRNEEREFNRRTADVSHRQHLENVKKIAKLESECQRLRLLVRKRLPGPAALAKMKNEVEVLGRDSFETRRTRLNSTSSLMVESSIDSSPETPGRRISTLTEQLSAVEEENKTLKESLNRKMSELQFSRVMLSRTASKLLQLESQIGDSPRSHLNLEKPRSNLALHEFSLASMSDNGSDDKASCAESWASALISELENFKSNKQKESQSCRSVGASDINLMDDFLEMEKLAIVSVEKAPEMSHASSKGVNEINGFSDTGMDDSTFDASGKEIVRVPARISNVSVSNQETSSIDILKGNVPGWLHEIVKLVLEQSCITHKTLDDIFEDVRVALRHLNNPDLLVFDPTKGSGLIDPSSDVNDADISSIKIVKEQSEADLSKLIGKIVELIEGISVPAVDYDGLDPLCGRDGNNLSHKVLGMPTGYMVRVFQWKTSELANVLQHFLHVCYDLLNGKADHGKFAEELTTALDWIMNHCFSIQDVSSMRDAIKKQFDWDETRSESEAEASLFTGADKLPQVTTAGGDDLHTGEMYYAEKEELKNIKDKLVSAESQKGALEGRLKSATDRIESLISQLQESEKTITSLTSDLQSLKESNAVLEGQIKKLKLANSDLDVQHKEAELKEAYHKVFTLEVELENKTHCCEDLETRCLELQLHLESMSKNCSNNAIDHKDKPLRTDWEITAASEKLAECQETILNLGKQLKAIAAPKDAALFDNAIANAVTNTAPANTSHVGPSPALEKDMRVKNRSLLDQMLAEDDSKAKVSKESDGKTTHSNIPGNIETLEKILVLNGTKGNDDEDAVNSLAIVPAKKQGSGSLWKKLWRKKKSANKKAPLPSSNI
ncbi:filament-like plant protein 7 [Arachis duranensis]|uniref:Filament-like plant protein 7 n=1 Tax=Arachis duranensis TaxID=130453 RepID=A0A6P4CVT9_ARADU|nr:filament-like plant protein 7 [Arachis duranensis]XP_015955334.1 filament-like plant protein 7 [Arachis duranensis]